METVILTDTCVLIEYLRGRETTIQEIQSLGIGRIALNSIIVMELFQGARNKQELHAIKKKISPFGLLDLDQTIFTLSTQLIEQYTLAYGLRLADAVIGATALIYDLPLYTYNQKDFVFLSTIQFYSPHMDH